MSIHILGIRHHGPGSARNVKAYLEELKPDIVLVEGPPDANALFQWADNKELKPPVSILIYQPENPSQALFYPFAEFSPEWQAIKYAKENSVPLQFMDLPIVHYFALQRKKEAIQEKKSEEAEISSDNDSIESTLPKYQDPISMLAQTAGFEDGEKWWEHQFEYRLNNEEVFEAVKEAMQELREHFPNQRDPEREELREAYMRKIIREAEKEGFKNIAIICGAWHSPALADLKNTKSDNDLLRGLPKIKVESTWAPWTYNRLSFYSGYGAGIESPGWYHHLWKHPKDDGTRWIVKVAKLLRKKNLDVSVAHVIEAVRLAEALAILRNLSRPGLEEMNDAVLTVICNGEPVLMDLIHAELTVSNRIGSVPTEIPKPPLQLDIEKNQKKLRLIVTPDPKEYVLDLRKETDLARSIFLHRLALLEINWGTKQQTSGKGTFKEQWNLTWDPELSITIIEKGNWGTTIEEAASNFVINKTESTISLQEVSSLLESTIPSELPFAINSLIDRINNLAASTSDVIQLMEVIPGLVTISRYGNVRKTDADLVFGIARSMLIRICAGLPSSCISINEDSAKHLLELFLKINDSINILHDSEITLSWQETLSSIAFNQNTSPSIAGYATRLLYDQKLLTEEKLMATFSYSMSPATPPLQIANWLEGFLKGSGTILLIDEKLWKVVDNWVFALNEENFIQVLPLLRRAFSEFTNSERKKLGEKAKSVSTISTKTSNQPTEEFFDHRRAKQGVPVVLQLLGIN